MAVTSQSKRVGVRDQSIIASHLCRHTRRWSSAEVIGIIDQTRRKPSDTQKDNTPNNHNKPIIYIRDGRSLPILCVNVGTHILYIYMSAHTPGKHAQTFWLIYKYIELCEVNCLVCVSAAKVCQCCMKRGLRGSISDEFTAIPKSHKFILTNQQVDLLRRRNILFELVKHKNFNDSK